MISINNLIIDRIGRNEIGHMSVSLNITLIIGLLFGLIHGATIAFIIGAAKEISDDYETNNHFSWRDMLYNAIGIAVGILILIMI